MDGKAQQKDGGKNELEGLNRTASDGESLRELLMDAALQRRPNFPQLIYSLMATPLKLVTPMGLELAARDRSP